MKIFIIALIVIWAVEIFIAVVAFIAMTLPGKKYFLAHYYHDLRQQERGKK